VYFIKNRNLEVGKFKIQNFSRFRAGSESRVAV
jgi:hypothetical protein